MIQDSIELRLKSIPLKVQLPDSSIKTVIVDQTLPLSSILINIGEKLGIKNCDEYGLKKQSNQDLAYY